MLCIESWCGLPTLNAVTPTKAFAYDGKALIPYTPCPMMWYHVRFISLFLFRQIIQEEVDQNSVDLCVWLDLENLSSEELDAPDTAPYMVVSKAIPVMNRMRLTSYLHFPRISRLDHVESPDFVFEWRTIPHYA